MTPPDSYTQPDASFDASSSGELAPVQLALGAEHTCVRWSDGSVRCWGHNHHGQLGDGTTTDRRDPTQPVGLGRAVDLVAGGDHTCARAVGGSVWCWGGRSDTATDLGGRVTVHSVDRAVPTRVDGIGGAVRLAAAFGRTCAVTSGGELWCWTLWPQGADWETFGQPDSARPTRQFDLAGVADVAIDLNAMVVLLRDGTIRAWGANFSGELGDGTTVEHETPVAPAGLDGARGIAGADDSFCAVSHDGLLRCWGGLLNPSYPNASVGLSRRPEVVAGVGPVEQVEAALVRACVRLRDGTVSCWGMYPLTYGLGCRVETPVVVEGIAGATDVAVGSQHACAIANSPTGPAVVCWGANDFGQLGAHTVPGVRCSGPVM